ncbi:YqzE family protein [Metabacillus fastidiosus]|uniref:YqzE family protein n=1 Tax=Metabacillus fastidiosus TaxID=1458 RepID=A0ABU6NUU3_9BACI|nr:YqzE family protein [Metabacillus fastidiosus]MED4400913.1 YqzE family protein [Metabacillus fastidiosus]MED4463839.1 YqzE family protein [Metabacillus fastidiosus]MED4530695.1 YqzE family protein [Metabacillus fastidiosus]
MSTNDYVKYVTQQLVKYMDTPKEERKQKKEEKKKVDVQPYSNQWLGILPFAFKLMVNKKKK